METIQQTSVKRLLRKPHMRKMCVDDYATLKKLQNWPWAEGRPSKLDFKLSCNLKCTISINYSFVYFIITF